MRRPALSLLPWIVALVANASPARAGDCGAEDRPCVDAEPLWLAPGATRFLSVAGAEATPPLQLGLSVAVMARLRPAVLLLPAPNREGRELNALRFATDASLAWAFGLGHGLELTGTTPLGLYQSGAGIKGVTHQSAPPLRRSAVHDPRFGAGYAFGPRSSRFGVKARLELKLPLGDADALAGEPGVVTSPSLSFAWRGRRLFAGAELGVRLRESSELFGARVGSQGAVSLGVGYALAEPRLRFALEAYLLPSLVEAGTTPYLPAEWLGSLTYAPVPAWSAVLGAGSGIPLAQNADGSSFMAFGVPAFRGLLLVRFSPGAEPAPRRDAPR